MGTDKINKANPFNSPLLGQEVHVKDYTTSIGSGGASNATQKVEVPTQKEEPIKIPEEKVQTSNIPSDLPPPPPPQEPESFGTNYENDGVPEYEDTQINNEDEDANVEPEKAEVQMPEIDAKLFSKIALGGIKNYIPALFVGLSAKITRVRQKDIDFFVATKKIDPAFAELYKKDRADLKRELKLTDEEATLLQESLEAYLKYQNISTANPANAFFLQAAMIGVRLTITSIQRGAEARNRWELLFKQKGISDYRNHSYEIVIKDEK